MPSLKAFSYLARLAPTLIRFFLCYVGIKKCQMKFS
uniref:Uncharacterized protein n=1 Tax=Arundo donax TaxID=35708 RepID=A0A0A8ZNT0_ARUDO